MRLNLAINADALVARWREPAVVRSFYVRPHAFTPLHDLIE